jgi:hypothetical protein
VLSSYTYVRSLPDRVLPIVSLESLVHPQVLHDFAVDRGDSPKLAVINLVCCKVVQRHYSPVPRAPAVTFSFDPVPCPIHCVCIPSVSGLFFIVPVVVAAAEDAARPVCAVVAFVSSRRAKGLIYGLRVGPRLVGG